MSTLHEQIIKIGSLLEIAGGGQIRNCGFDHAQWDILGVLAVDKTTAVTNCNLIRGRD